MSHISTSHAFSSEPCFWVVFSSDLIHLLDFWKSKTDVSFGIVDLNPYWKQQSTWKKKHSKSTVHLEFQNHDSFLLGVFLSTQPGFHEARNIPWFPEAAGFGSILGGSFKHCLFSPRTLGKIPILTNIFQRGWNHQQVLRSYMCFKNWCGWTTWKSMWLVHVALIKGADESWRTGPVLEVPRVVRKSPIPRWSSPIAMVSIGYGHQPKFRRDFIYPWF